MKPNDPFFDFALEAGGSHYPHINSNNLIYFGRLIAEECARIARTNGESDVSSKILERFAILSFEQKQS